MWPFRGRTPEQRITRARQMMSNRHYLDAREELEGIDDPVARELYAEATRAQIDRLLGEIAAQQNLADGRATEFVSIAQRLGATPEEIAAARQGSRPARAAPPPRAP